MSDGIQRLSFNTQMFCSSKQHYHAIASKPGAVAYIRNCIKIRMSSPIVPRFKLASRTGRVVNLTLPKEPMSHGRFVITY